MHYYSFNIGDYHSHTAHLELLEDLAYRRMIDFCYLNEKPLPVDVDEIARLIRMRTHSECIANVLRDFFYQLESGEWVNKRIAQEVTEYNKKSEKCKAAALKRWGNKDLKSDADAMRTHSERNANHKPITNNHKPLNKSTRKRSLREDLTDNSWTGQKDGN